MYYSAEIAVDHITDHLPFRSIRKQWTGERRRVRFSERKGVEKAIFSGNCPYRFVWDHQAAGSNPVTRTISSVHNRFELWTLAFLFSAQPNIAVGYMRYMGPAIIYYIAKWFLPAGYFGG